MRFQRRVTLGLRGFIEDFGKHSKYIGRLGEDCSSQISWIPRKVEVRTRLRSWSGGD